ncbi:unnamed protein product [Ceratitis capitata]|uniref:(Mediterranean fruit fly) hypothetical protein n=1 Tax=Ceratitis capitata TaxID=7213 RepID=A0A811V213_CERCA|nr:unnamed protein product [Ceratitis capitata]
MRLTDLLHFYAKVLHTFGSLVERAPMLISNKEVKNNKKKCENKKKVKICQCWCCCFWCLRMCVNMFLEFVCKQSRLNGLTFCFSYRFANTSHTSTHTHAYTRIHKCAKIYN